MVVPQSPLPQYDTNEPELRPPTAPAQQARLLKACNKEIEDEMRLYSTVQSYEKKAHFAGSSGRGNDWLKRNLQNRLNQSGQALARRSGSWRPNGSVTGALNGSVMSCDSVRSSSQSRVMHSAQGKDNKVM